MKKMREETFAMYKLIAFSVLVLFPALCNAQELTKLQCEGKYNDYTTSDIRNLLVTGIYLEISDGHVKIIGAPGFEGTYSVIGRPESGIGIRLDSNNSYEGFLNRFSGELSLLGGVVEIDGRVTSSKKSLFASCSTARSLF